MILSLELAFMLMQILHLVLNPLKRSIVFPNGSTVTYKRESLLHCWSLLLSVYVLAPAAIGTKQRELVNKIRLGTFFTLVAVCFAWWCVFCTTPPHCVKVC